MQAQLPVHLQAAPPAALRQQLLRPQQAQPQRHRRRRRRPCTRRRHRHHRPRLHRRPAATPLLPLHHLLAAAVEQLGLRLPQAVAAEHGLHAVQLHFDVTST